MEDYSSAYTGAQIDSGIAGGLAVPTMDSAIKAGTEATAVYHLGFYLDANGDLCQVDDEEEE